MDSLDKEDIVQLMIANMLLWQEDIARRRRNGKGVATEAFVEWNRQRRKEMESYLAGKLDDYARAYHSQQMQQMGR